MLKEKDFNSIPLLSGRQTDDTTISVWDGPPEATRIMHKMSLSVHKNTNEKSTGELKNDTKITVLDIERENRLAKVTSLYSKGLNQEEIALELHVEKVDILVRSND